MAEAQATPINPASKPKKTTKEKAVPWDRDGVDGGNSINQKLSNLQSSYNTARDWKRNTGAGILESDAVNGVKTVKDQVHFLCQYWDILDPVMGLRSVAKPLYTQSSVPDPEGQMDNPTGDSIGNKNSNLLSSSQDTQSDDDKDKITTTQALASAPAPTASTAKVSYMKELRELGLEYSEIKKEVNEEFPAIPDILADSKEDESDSDEDSS
ncbi:hypothetical protein PtB15_10B525 [Puccinia triticina]|nr:hypothetical protein PtB15_10B525 [Puccinia triticina]